MPKNLVKVRAKRNSSIKRTRKKSYDSTPFEFINFEEVNKRALSFADYIESHFKQIADILLEYESYEVVKDEFSRTMDLLRNLQENKEYFVLRIGAVASFLPRNQPLYAFTCFVLVPSLMASEVHFRIPNSMRHFFPRLLRTLKISNFFSNVIISDKERLKFLKDRSALCVDPKTEESLPITDAVIFTGTSQHAEKLRVVFDQRTLFIANGSGHNPIVVAEDADINKAVDAALTLQLYNQGQDCAAPNAILVHKYAFKPFMRLLHSELKKIQVGQYSDKSCRVGPISDPDDLKRIQELLVDNREWLDPATPGIVRTSDSIVEPTIICKPLKEGGNFTEVFAPIFFIQEYKDDSDLSLYFESSHYARNAMYISVYGESRYIKKIIDKQFEGKVLHDSASVLHDTHLHMPGIERGTQPYGGYGYAASSFSINGKVTSKATLPQRDIYEQLAKPLLVSGEIQKRRRASQHMSKILVKDVQKLMGLKAANVAAVSNGVKSEGKHYVDLHEVIASDSQRYIEFEAQQVFVLLDHPNIEFIATLEPRHIRQIRALRKLLEKRQNFSAIDLKQMLYSLARSVGVSEEENRAEQLTFFKNVYQLLLGKDSGPRLPQFLVDADRGHVVSLLNI